VSGSPGAAPAAAAGASRPGQAGHVGDVFSLGDLTTFLACPRRWLFLNRHLAPFLEERPAPGRTVGNLVHHSLRLYHRAPVAALAGPARAARLAEAFAALRPRFEPVDPDVVARAQAMLQQYLGTEPAGTDAWLLEAEVNVRLDAASGPFFLRGFADRVDRDGDEVRIVDYKTRPFTPEAHAGYARQVALYLAAARRGILGQVGALNFARAEILYLAPTQAWLVPAEPDLAVFEAWAAATVDAIRRETAWQAPGDTGICADCAFIALCRPGPR